MIEQQYYTRERGGLFSQTDGYDTVAKSPQLKLDYIKKNLHPLCSYDIPSELQRIGEQEEDKYPPNMVVMPGPSGEFIIGQAVYKAKDFTGLRSTFFMHNFILSENEKYRYIKEPEKIFGITGFKTSFNLAEGRQLPTLAAVPFNADNPYFMERERLFGKLGISQEIFHKLIYATFIAVHSKKKIFIVLDVKIEELGDMAKALLYHLYSVLPWSITEKLGVCTYANKVEAKKNIHITFLDKNTLHYDMKLGKDFIFDFANKKFLNVEGDVEGEPYIRSGISYAKNKAAWEKINHWAYVLGTTLENNEQKNISFYGKVITLFELSLCLKAGKSYDLTSPKIRRGLMEQTFTYLQCDIADDIRKELFEIMEYIIRLLQEEIGQGELIEIEELRSLLRFKLEYCRNREQEEHCIQIVLHLLTVASREKNYGYVYDLLDQVHLYKNTYRHLFEAMYTSDELKKQVVYYLIRESFKEIKELDELIDQMAKFEEVESILLKDRYYAQVIYERFGSYLLNVKEPMAFLHKLQQWCNKHQEAIYANLLEQGEYYFLEHIQLKNIPNEQMLCKLSFSRSYPLETYDIIQDYQRLKTDLSYMTPNKIRVNSKVQELVKLFYKQKPKKDDFYMLVYAFLEMDQTTHQLRLNLKRVLTYLNSIHTKVILDFIIWAKGQEMYIDKKRFDRDVVDFFVLLKQRGEKIDKELIRTRLGGQAKTKKLSEKILSALKPNIVKWVGRNGRLIVATFLLVVVGVGSGIGFYNHQNKKASTHKVIKGQEIDQATITKLMPSMTINQEEIEADVKAYMDLISAMEKNGQVKDGETSNEQLQSDSVSKENQENLDGEDVTSVDSLDNE